MGALCNRSVVVAAPEESVRTVAGLMRHHHVGCVVIVRGPAGNVVPVGIVTDRDIVLEVVATDRDSSATQISEIMTPQPFTAREQSDLYEVLHELRKRGLRRVPVVDARDVLQGIFTFDDIIDWAAEHMSELSRLIQTELHQEREPLPRP